MNTKQSRNIQNTDMSDGNESDCEESYPVRTVKKTNIMKILIAVLLIGLMGVAVAIPAVMLTRKQVASDPIENEVITYDFPYVSRSEWGARKPVEIIKLRTPVPYVVIHHSYTPKACYNKDECIQAMRSMQDFHIDDRHWWDIGYQYHINNNLWICYLLKHGLKDLEKEKNYKILKNYQDIGIPNFGVGSDGVAYEGRGWPILGAHSLHFNNISIGICVIGDWTNATPPAEQMKTVKSLIAAGVELGYVKPNYKLVGHRQVRDTECPGQSFFEEIKTWDHWSDFPASYKDLANVPELSEYLRESDNKTTSI